MALPLAPLLAGGLGLAALMAARRRKKGQSQDERAMQVGDVTGQPTGMAYGGKVKKMAKGGSVTRGDGACMKGHTKGKMR
jgi:hypothetical protein